MWHRPHRDSQCTVSADCFWTSFQDVFTRTLHNKQVAQQVAGCPQASWRGVQNTREQAACFHRAGQSPVKPDPRGPRFGLPEVPRVARSGSRTEAGALSLPSQHSAPPQAVGLAPVWLRVAHPGAREPPGAEPRRSRRAAAPERPLQCC